MLQPFLSTVVFSPSHVPIAFGLVSLLFQVITAVLGYYHDMIAAMTLIQSSWLLLTAIHFGSFHYTKPFELYHVTQTQTIYPYHNGNFMSNLYQDSDAQRAFISKNIAP